MLFGHFTERNKFTNAGIGENSVDSSLHLTDCLVKTIQIGQFCDVPLNARHVTADCLYGLIEFPLATARDEDWRRPVMKTYAPSLTKSCAVANPMPSVPPVMTATFPCNLPMS